MTLGFTWTGRTQSQDTAKVQAVTNSPSASPNLFPVDLGKGWHFQPLIRGSWVDVLGAGTAKAPAGAKPQGATFSYSHDSGAGSDSWSAEGAGMLSVQYSTESTDLKGWHFTDLGFAPIVAVDKVQAAKTNSVDHLYFAVGEACSLLYSEAEAPTVSSFLFGFQERAGFVYDTDTAFRARLPGGFLELEPQLLWNFGNQGRWLPWISPIGWNSVFGPLGHRWIEFQTRAWVHVEGGDIQQSGTNWNVVKGSFFRIGPELKEQITIPCLNNLALSAEYDYLPTVTGPSGKNYFYKLGASLPLPLWSGATAKDQPISITASYSKGGLVLSKQTVDFWTVGLSVVF